MPLTVSTTKSDLEGTQVNEYTFSMSESQALRVYADTRPHNLKIAELQKGLVLLYKEKELVGEGTGFGLPILMYSDETCFSASSTLHISPIEDGCVVVKQYFMDRMARNSFGNVTLENHSVRSFVDHFANIYQNHPPFRFLAIKALTGRIGIGKTFPQIATRGIVQVTYTIQNRQATITADFKHVVKTGLLKAFMLNEQAARIFRKYIDAAGTQLLDDKIGAWNPIQTDWAALKTLNDEIGFRLWRTPSGLLRRGREYLRGSLDWVGLDYELDSIPESFTYRIELLDVLHK
jgi:hypothetical protein